MYQFRKVSDRVARLRERYRNTPYTLDTERALILTASYKKNKHLHPAYAVLTGFMIFAPRKQFV